jgi:hypothetical protein
MYYIKSLCKKNVKKTHAYKKGLNSAYQRVNRDKTNRNIYIFTKFLLTLLSLVVSAGLKTDRDLSSKLDLNQNLKNSRLDRFML